VAATALNVLTVNAGSSSLKLRLIGPDDELVWSGDDLGAAAANLEVAAVGHRVVHGGTRFRESVLVDDAVIADLEALTDLAPLHQPVSLAALYAARKRFPGVPHVACFDTAFHAHLPEAAATYAVPADWRERLGVRRYGFHGLSHAYASRRAAEMLGSPERVVTCHLGAGASLAAVRGGASVDTTMGFTPLEGLVMATRSGTVDPGLVLWLQQRAGLSAGEIGDALEHRSGLAALAGTPDMREVLARGDEVALGVYTHRLRASIAAMAAAMDGLDALVFTGGVGENAPQIRARAAAGLGFVGVELDETANASTTPDADVGARGAAVRTLVIAAREDLEIAREVRRLVR
jgi:acetate kinase